MQRLFSEFPGGRPGLGLLVLRVVASAMVVTFEVRGLAMNAAEDYTVLRMSLSILLIGGGALVLLGFLTTLGSLVVGSIHGIWAISSALSSVAGSSGRWLCPLSIVGMLTTLVLAGPGGFSLDAYFFGPKCVNIPAREESRSAVGRRCDE